MDTFFKLLKLLWTRRDDLIAFLDKLPALLHEAGEGIEDAGENTKVVGTYLRGGPAAPVNARQVTAQTADYLDASHRLIRDAASVIAQAANLISQIKIPVLGISPVTIDLGLVGKWIVVGDIQIENKRLFEPVSDALQDGCDNLNDVGTNLKSAAEQLDALSQWFDSTGGELDKVGGKLINGGRALQELV